MSNTKPAPSVSDIAVEPWELAGAEDEPILGNTHRPPGTSPGSGNDASAIRGQAIICHGFKGYMDYGFIPRLADVLAQHGIAAHRFNFSHSGVTREFETFARPELFERETWTKQVFDLTRVVEHFGGQNGAPLAVFGHSRGGVTALLTASRLPDNQITRVIAAASPADAARLAPEARDLLLRTGRLPSPSGRTGQDLYVGRDWLTEIEADPEAHDPLIASAKLGGRVVHIHGDADPTVVLDDLHRYADANPEAETVVIPDADHVFNGPNPMTRETTPPPQTQALFDAVLAGLGAEFGITAD
ncbi:MAG: alpha/beta fold hydrolase [Planctomycetota bacterium]